MKIDETPEFTDNPENYLSRLKAKMPLTTTKTRFVAIFICLISEGK